MKEVILSVLFVGLFSNSPASAQQLSIQPGIGLGGVVSKKESNDSKRSRAMVQLRGYYNVAKKLSIGFEVSTAGSFTNSVGGNSIVDRYDPVTKTITADVSNMNADAILVKTRYYLENKEKVFKPFVELGAGLITYYRKVFDIAGTGEKKLTATNFAWQPEIGFSAGHLQLSILYTGGGKTPQIAYANNDLVTVNFIQRNVSSVYLNAGWKFNF